MLKRMILWGITAAIAGAVVADKSSYDSSGITTLYGAAIGLILGLLIALALDRLQKKG